LFFYSPRKDGGIGLTPRQMSFFFMLRPLLLVGYEVTAYPILAKKFGPEAIMRGTSFCYVIAYSIFLALSYLVSNPNFPETAINAVLILTIVINVIANPLFIAADQIIGGRAPTQAHIARLNAVSELVANLVSHHSVLCHRAMCLFAYYLQAAGLGLAVGGEESAPDPLFKTNVACSQEIYGLWHKSDTG
jgi:hypothetical protein